MANIAAADVGYAQVDAVISAPGRTRRRWTLTIPATTNVTYPAGGVPLNAPLIAGTARGIVAALKVIGQNVVAGSTNPMWNWNGSTTAPKLEAFVGGAALTNPLAEFSGAMTQNACTVTVEVENG